MKRFVMLLLAVLSLSAAYGQRFEYHPLENGDMYEVRIRKFDKLYGDRFVPEKAAKLPKEKASVRAAWRKKIADKVLDTEVASVLVQDGKRVAENFWMIFYADAEGKVIAVTFIMPSSLYLQLPVKLLRELYALAMQEKLKPDAYTFEENSTYAVEAVDLLQRLKDK